MILFTKKINIDTWISRKKILNLSQWNQISENSISMVVKIPVNFEENAFTDGNDIGVELFPIIILSSDTNEISKNYSDNEFYQIILGNYSLKIAESEIWKLEESRE